MGGLPWVVELYAKKESPVFKIDANGVPSSIPYVYKEFKPESMQSFEMGYKGLIGEKLLIDLYGYPGHYEDFLGRNSCTSRQRIRFFQLLLIAALK